MIQTPHTITTIERSSTRGVFEVGPLMPGYGATIANPLRRVLLSSLQGAAVTSIKIQGVDHEFSSIDHVLEDAIQIILNVKKIRLRSFADGPVTLVLEAKGEGVVTAGDMKLPADVEVVNPEQPILTITDKKATVSMELTVERGVGYVPTEQRQKEKLPIGVIAVDAIFSPVKLVNFRIDDIRVGDRIDFNKVTMEIVTDGTLTPEAALRNASEILADHFTSLAKIEVPDVTSQDAPAPKSSKKKEPKE
ncbi:MAG: DNA-directed RNA polymerase subunit alpha [Patescibacteria group bacterium]